MKRPFVRLCLGLLWLGSTGCDSKTRDYSGETLGSGATATQTGASHADAAVGAGASSSGSSTHGANTANPVSSNGQASGSGAATLDGAPPSGSGDPADDAGVGSSSSAGTGTAGSSSSGGPLDGDAGSGSAGPGGNGNGSPDSSVNNGGTPDGGTEVGGNESALAAATEFCDAYFVGICKRRVACGRDCTSGGGYRNYPIECHDALASLQQGFVTYNAENAAECLAGYEVSGCVGGAGADPAACSQVFLGAVDLGDECAATEFAHVFDECATGFCKRAQLQNPQRLECLGTCAAYSGLGKTCDENSTLNLRCTPDLVCVDNKCEQPGGIDVSCEDIPCQAGLVCSDIAPFTCRDPGPEHSTCRDSGDCTNPAVCVNSECVVWIDEGGFCRSDGSCTGGYCVNNVCAPVVAAGATCGDEDRCTVGFDCSLYEPRTCIKAVGEENEPCGPWGRCGVGLWCTDSQTGECVPTLGEGGACSANSTCNAGSWCMADGKCHAPGEQDGPCTPEAPYATCAAAFFCDPETALCDAPRAEGEACNSITLPPGQACQAGLYCLCVGDDCPRPPVPHPEDHCVPQKADGTSCGNTTECLSGGCVETLCGPPPVPPANCTR